MLAAQGRKVDRAVLFEIPDEDLVTRLSGRRTCLKCGAMYHVETAPTKVPGVCDQCGSALVQRDDDKIEVIQKRLKVYHEQTAPVAGFYAKANKLRTIDARKSYDEVTGLLNEALRN
jgi:adenylate kinase